MQTLVGVVIAFIFALVIFFVVSIVMAIPVMLLWDWLMPILFNLKEITLMQAWGLSFLCALLFKTNVSSKDE